MTNKIDAIILAGGLGTRLREVVSGSPKVLAPVNKKPFLDLILNFLNKSRIVHRVVIAAGYLADHIIEEYGNRDEFDFEIVFSVEKELLGTGGAIRQAMNYVSTQDVLAVNGDSYIDVDLSEVKKAHIENNAAMTIVLKHVEDCSRYGTVKFDKDKRIVCFEEKNGEHVSGYINAGVYIIRREIFDDVEENKVISLEKDLFPAFLNERVFGYISNAAFLDIGIPETYSLANNFFKEIL